MAFKMPNSRLITATTGVIQLVVQDALEVIELSYLMSPSLTEIMWVAIEPLGGAEITTRLAPAVM